MLQTNAWDCITANAQRPPAMQHQHDRPRSGAHKLSLHATRLHLRREAPSSWPKHYKPPKHPHKTLKQTTPCIRPHSHTCGVRPNKVVTTYN